MPLAFLDVKAINAGRSVRLKSTIKIMICQKLILKELLIFWFLITRAAPSSPNVDN
tara:strand:+ start:650 stop:817 length:168 start_codon:yes stop_codon:yes gene_type:complete